MVGDWQDDRVGSALRGENPTVLARLPGAFAVIGDVQWLPGYCVLLTDTPGVEKLSDLPRERRLRFLDSMERLAEAVERACAESDDQFRRVNLEILGNQDVFLHAHVWPRYGWEPPDRLSRPVWLYPPTMWTDPTNTLDERHRPLRDRLAALLSEHSRGRP
ncbi:DeoR family transcriptional regulator [Pseudonocardia kongjuensis]|uniref:DeoR family transcriptional regulator n=1 Tax=Pseudonocardia kongjuensis TaxID=102227 RepID=A0ABP4IMI0_9PSEU